MRRLPTAVKALTGTLRKDRINPREPRQPLAAPRPRQTLAAVARAEHRRLVAALKGLGVMTRADGLALELTAQALAEYRTAVGTLLREGQSYQATTEAGAVMHRARPEQAIAADAWRRAMHGLEQFGLTPVARGKVETLKGLPPLPDFFEAFQRRRQQGDPHAELARRRSARFLERVDRTAVP